MNKIPTAEEYLLSKGFSGFAKHTLTKKWLIEFAKIHVEAALKSASEKAKMNIVVPPLTREEQYTVINKESILNAYDLNNIK